MLTVSEPVLFEHQDVCDRDSLYIMPVDCKLPDLGVLIGGQNADEHVVVQVRPEALDRMIRVLQRELSRARNA